MSVTIRYELEGAGWASCTLRVDEQEVRATASYLSDALDDLASAVAAALRGYRAEATFEEEPGAYRWIFEPRGRSEVCVRVLWFDRAFPRQREDTGRVVFDAVCRLRTLAGGLLSELQRLAREYGREGYREQWGRHELPVSRIEELKALLDGVRGGDG